MDMEIDLGAFLDKNTVAMLFLVLGTGYLIGKTKIKGFELGSVAGVLFAGLIFGRFGFEISPAAQSFGFALFIFSVGLQAGPTFFSAVAEDGLKYLILSITIAGTGFFLAATLAGVLGLEPGSSAGILSGGLTSSPTLAAAQDAIRGGAVTPPQGTTADEMLTNVTTAYAITYIFGLVGLIIIIGLIPRILRIDLAAEAQKLEESRKGGEAEAPMFGGGSIVTRAYCVESEKLAGKKLKDLHETMPGVVTIQKIKRGDRVFAPDEETAVEMGDLISVVGHLDVFIEKQGLVGPEVADADLLDIETESCRIVITRSKPIGKKVKELQITEGYGCFLSHIRRATVTIEATQNLIIKRGDVLNITGPHDGLERLGKELGHLERKVDETDLLTFAFGITAGILVGSLSIKVGNLSIGLGTAGGLLVAGLSIGFLRSIHPTFGRVPSAARWIFMELGLLIFMAGVGLRAGQGIVEALMEAGPSLFVAGVIVTVTPVAVGFLIGRVFLKLNPVLLLGAITGSMTSGACLSIVTKAAKSPMPALGYTGAYAFANVLLTIAGTVILRL